MPVFEIFVLIVAVMLVGATIGFIMWWRKN